MKKQTIQLYKEITGSVNTAPLSQIMPKALTLARELGDTKFEKIIRLELNGYYNFNPALTEDVKVPKYRFVVGQHLDLYGRPIRTAPNLEFINHYPLRFGIDELEKMGSSEEVLTIQDNFVIADIHSTFHVETIGFSFNTFAITGILSSIRIILVDWLYDIQRSYPELANEVNSETNSSQIVHIDHGASVNNLVFSHSIDNSFNKTSPNEISDELQKTLKDLANSVYELVAALPHEAAEQVVGDLEILTREAKSKSPRKQWWKLSADGLKKAAENVGEIGKPVIELVGMLVTILSKKP